MVIDLEYKWTAMTTVFIATLIGSINMMIILIAIPAIFNGININPLNSFPYLLWILMGYMLVVAILLLSFGRLSDMYGRVKMFQYGFLIFTVGSVLLYLTPSTGDAGALEIIIFRMIQAVGGALFMANSGAILADAFSSDERGKALGINTVAGMSGNILGLILGGTLAVFNWRYIFLVSVPFGLIGTILSFYKLKELSIKARCMGKFNIRFGYHTNANRCNLWVNTVR
jgi:MFS family permease